MNRRLIFKILGLILILTAVFMLLPVFVALIYGEEDWKYFLIPLLISAGIGAVLFKIKLKTRHIYAKEGLFIVGAAWVILSLIGAVPYFISGFIPDFVNALFESVSGFTTSGISVVQDLEIASHAMLFWRSLTHWIGGMGVLVFMLAISPVVGGSSMHLMRAEAPGPTTEKITPKISETAKWLYFMYLVLTGCEIVALVISGLSFFRATLISFGTLATGGFSFMNDSLASFTTAQQIVVGFFMILAGVNFSLYFLVITGKVKRVFRDIELRWYLFVLAFAVLMVSLNVYFSWGMFESFGQTLHQAAFATISAMTSTGFAIFDYNLWPNFSKVLLLVLMFVGGCAGSTAGGIKVSRFILMFKSVKRTIRESVNPKGFKAIRYNGKTVQDSVIRSANLYFLLILIILVFSMLIVALEPGMDIGTALASVATTLNNNGIELKNPAVAGFANYSWWSRLVYIIDMLIGRLEIFPILIWIIYVFRPLNNGARVVKRRTRMFR